MSGTIGITFKSQLDLSKSIKLNCPLDWSAQKMLFFLKENYVLFKNQELSRMKLLYAGKIIENDETIARAIK